MQGPVAIGDHECRPHLIGDRAEEAKVVSAAGHKCIRLDNTIDPFATGLPNAKRAARHDGHVSQSKRNQEYSFGVHGMKRWAPDACPTPIGSVDRCYLVQW